jgi:hypothetical protein
MIDDFLLFLSSCMQNVLRACQEQGVGRLIYVSTYNSVFDGKPIAGGDESLPYINTQTCPCIYSVSVAFHQSTTILFTNTHIEPALILEPRSHSFAGNQDCG